MKNYWLDKRSERVEGRWKRLEMLSGQHFILNKSIPASAVSHKLELHQSGKLVLPLRPTKYTVSGNKQITVTVEDDGSFPIKSYRWLSEVYDWGRRRGPTVEGTFRTYVGNKLILEEHAVLNVEDMYFSEIDHTSSEAVKIAFIFSLVGHEARDIRLSQRRRD